ncbi:MAG: hypothetical protein ABH826_00450 [Patescibacteria group bacterium]
MNDEKWGQVIDMVEGSFEVEERDKYELDQDQGGGKAEYIIFQGPQGKMKLVREQKPKMIGRKVISSHRIGGASHEEFQYSDSEIIDKISAYLWNEQQQDWQPIDSDIIKV